MEFTVFVIVLVCGLWVGFRIGLLVKEKQLRNKVIDKRNIKECFNGVDWGVHRFICGNSPMTAPDGIEHFYKVPSISAAIEKLNDLLNSSPA